MNERMNYERVCRTAPATPGLSFNPKYIGSECVLLFSNSDVVCMVGYMVFIAHVGLIIDTR